MLWQERNIARVFLTKTKATPDDKDVFIGHPPITVPKGNYDEIHISVTFTWDKGKVREIEDAWKSYGNVKVGGPAFIVPEGEFVPGLYLKKGYVITSRGCPNRCWFCSVWRKHPKTKELEIKEGYNIQDDNLLACSDKHIVDVFCMLKNQKDRPTFSGGLEARLINHDIVSMLKAVKPQQFFLAYDTPSDYEPLVKASKMLRKAGFNRNSMRCYLLIGYKNDSLQKAEERAKRILRLGMYPMAMLYKNEDGSLANPDPRWKSFQRTWARPAAISVKEKEYGYKKQKTKYVKGLFKKEAI